MKKFLLLTLLVLVLSTSVLAITLGFNCDDSIAFAVDPTYVEFPSDWKDLYETITGNVASQITSIAFASSSDIPSGYTEDWQVGLDSYSYMLGTTSIKIYHKTSNISDILFVSNDIIKAPIDSTELFAFYTEDTPGTKVYNSSLKSINLNNFVTSHVTNMNDMFRGDKNITSLDLSSLDMTSVTSADYLLKGIGANKIIAPINVPNSISIGLDYEYLNENKDTFSKYINYQTCSTNSGSLNAVIYLRGYKITWKNYNDEKILETLVGYGKMPVYSGDTPKQPGTENNIYRFSSWIPSIKQVTADTSYTAKYDVAQAALPVADTLKSKYEILTGNEMINIEKISFSKVIPVGYTGNWNSETKYIDNDGAIQICHEETNINDIVFVCLSPIYAPENCNNLFKNCPKLEYVDLSYLNMSKTVDVDDMFSATFPDVIIAPQGGTVTIDLVSTYKCSLDNTMENTSISSLQRSSIVAGVMNQVKFERTIKTVWYIDDEIFDQQIRLYNGQKQQVDTPKKESTIQYDYAFLYWNPIIDEFDYGMFKAVFEQTIRKYLIQFLDGNDTVIYSKEFEYGSIPTFAGDTPVKANDDYYSYTFCGWNIEMMTVTGDYTYKPMFNATLLEQEIVVPFWGYIIIGLGFALILSFVFIAIGFRIHKRKSKARREKIFNSDDDDNLFNDDDLSDEEDTNDDETDLDYNDKNIDFDGDFDFEFDDEETTSLDNEESKEISNNIDESDFLTNDELNLDESDFLSLEDLNDDSNDNVIENNEEVVEDEIIEEPVIEETSEVEELEQLIKDAEETIEDNGEEETRTKLDDFFDTINNEQEPSIINQPVQKKKEEASEISKEEIEAIREAEAIKKANREKIDDDEEDSDNEIKSKGPRFALLPALIDFVLNTDIKPSNKTLHKYASVLMDLYYKYPLEEDRSVLKMCIERLVEKMK